MEQIKSAEEYFENIKKEIKYKNRFFIDRTFCEYIEAYARQDQNKMTINPKEKYFYRARLYLEDDRYEKYRNPPSNIFAGYDEKNSFVNLTNSVEGRGNPCYISYLYVSTTIEGAITEIRPYANTLVSVAEIDVVEQINILNFAKNYSISNEMFEAELFMCINNEFSKPNYDNTAYFLTQYICEYAKKLNFDGVCYCSAFESSVKAIADKNIPNINLVIFNYDKCKAINSKLHFVSKVVPHYRECVGNQI